MQAGFGYPQQLVPGMRPGGAPMPNFFVPMGQQGQQGQRPGGRRGAGPMHQIPQSLPMMQQQVYSCTASWNLFYFSCFCSLCLLLRCFLLVFFQMLPRGRVYRYPPPGRNLQGVPLPGVTGGTPIQALATALANAPPEQQRTVRPFLANFLVTLGLITC